MLEIRAMEKISRKTEIKIEIEKNVFDGNDAKVHKENILMKRLKTSNKKLMTLLTIL